MKIPKLPHILTADELVALAFRRAAKEGKRALYKGGPKRTRIRRSERTKIMTASKTVQRKLGELLKTNWDDLPPFYHELIEALIGIDKIKSTVKNINETIKKVKNLEKAYNSKLGKAKELEVIYRSRSEFYGRLASLIKKLSEDLEFLAKVKETVNEFPVVEETFTIVIAGAPNVGKSTLLRALTTATPKVESYPFTTKKILLGYFHSNHQRYQVVDTPGLLDRPLEDRNPIERQAILALKHLADEVLFVLDPSESCGFELKTQLNIYHSIKKEFPHVIPILNKADLLTSEEINNLQKKLKGAKACSALTGEGVTEIIKEIIKDSHSQNQGP